MGKYIFFNLHLVTYGEIIQNKKEYKEKDLKRLKLEVTENAEIERLVADITSEIMEAIK